MSLNAYLIFALKKTDTRTKAGLLSITPIQQSAINATTRSGYAKTTLTKKPINVVIVKVLENLASVPIQQKNYTYHFKKVKKQVNY